MIGQLIIPMYRLITTSRIEEITFDEANVSFFRRDYSLEERFEQFEALRWAMANPDYDFKGISPIFEDVKFSNKEIYEYLKRIYEFMESNSLEKE